MIKNHRTELQDYFKTHNKSKEQKAHTSKVSQTHDFHSKICVTSRISRSVLNESNFGRQKVKLSLCFQVHSVGWNCLGTRLASGSFDKSVAIFSLERDRFVSKANKHRNDQNFSLLLNIRFPPGKRYHTAWTHWLGRSVMLACDNARFAEHG